MSTLTSDVLARNLYSVRSKIEDAAHRAGVPLPRLLAVTKSCDDDTFRALLSLGVDAVGENRARQCQARAEIIAEENAPCEMHLIGSLQTNKVKYVLARTALIHSVDSLSLADEIERLAIKAGRRIAVLAEVNSGREPNKGGVMPETLDEFVHAIKERPHLSLCGLMTMAPLSDEKEAYRPYFRETRRAFDRLQALFEGDKPILSMGMSNSFETAIEEGATLVRVGSALFCN